MLPELLKGFSAVPPLLTDIDLSLDDRYLYASCWGTGEMRQYDVSDPFNPKLVGSVHIGGIARRGAAPGKTKESPGTADRRWSKSAATGGASILRTRSTARWDDQFYPDGLKSWMVKLDVEDGGAMAFDPRFSSSSTPASAASSPPRRRRRLVGLVLLLVDRSRARRNQTMTQTQPASATSTKVYRLQGTLLEACSCRTLCRCWIGEDPDGGACDSFLAYNIEKGEINGARRYRTDLRGGRQDSGKRAHTAQLEARKLRRCASNRRTAGGDSRRLPRPLRRTVSRPQRAGRRRPGG